VAIEGLSIRPYLDHNFQEQIGFALRREGFDVVIAREIGHERLSDEDHLRWATARGRTVLTHDKVDFTTLNQAWAERGENHAGIVICKATPQLAFREILSRLLNVLNSVTADEMTNRLLWLDESRADPR
jgi:hypothetical protein